MQEPYMSSPIPIAPYTERKSKGSKGSKKKVKKIKAGVRRKEGKDAILPTQNENKTNKLEFKMYVNKVVLCF
jgi:hypothetical protein